MKAKGTKPTPLVALLGLTSNSVEETGIFATICIYKKKLGDGFSAVVPVPFFSPTRV